MSKNIFLRAWFYFRQGWGMYFAFVFSAINTMVVTYYLAIENAPILKEIFPTFVSYLLIMVAIGVPILVTVGYIHYKKIAAYANEAEVVAESHPYYFKLPPGWPTEVQFPFYVTMTEMLLKISQNDKLSKEDIEKIAELQKKAKTLLDGGYVGAPKSKMTS